MSENPISKKSYVSADETMLQVKLPRTLHRQVKAIASANGEAMHKFVQRALKFAVTQLVIESEPRRVK